VSSKRSNNSFGFNLFITGLVALAATAIGAAIWFLLGRPDLWGPNEAASMGQKGDFFGGFLNPILTTLTFAAFLATVLMQRTELQESRRQFDQSTEEMKRQNETAQKQTYQAGFFQLLTMYDNIVNSMTIDNPVTGKTANGRQVFNVMYSNMRRVYRKKRDQFPKAGESRALLFAFETLFQKEHHQLPHYFRFLYNAIKMIEQGPEAHRYIKIFRAAISNQELLILYYNCAISSHGKKFREIAERHSLFDNMSPRLLEPFHAELLDQTAFGPGGYSALLEQGRPKLRGDLSPIALSNRRSGTARGNSRSTHGDGETD
jgi:Putative phage abortive infection protein